MEVSPCHHGYPCHLQATSGELRDFKEWLAQSVRADHPYLLQVEATDVQPCLTFPNKEVGVVEGVASSLCVYVCIILLSWFVVHTP